jgi:hypothetical protein
LVLAKFSGCWAVNVNCCMSSRRELAMKMRKSYS